MDNVSHTLIGIGLGAFAIQAREMDAPARRAALWTVILASNAPDIDALLPPILGGGNLTYLLQHRGFTHTLVLVPLLSALSLIAGAKIGGLDLKELWAGRLRPGSPLRVLGVLALAAGVLHIGADYWNNYGVHPFWPISNEWFYGDWIFIVEPLLWLSLIPFALTLLESKAAKALWGVLALAILTASWLLPEITPFPVPIFLTLWLGLWLKLHSWTAPGAPGQRSRLALAGIALASLLLTFAGASRTAKSEAMNALRAFRPEERILDVVATPSPGNPICWSLITLSENGGTYVARKASLSHLPAVMSPARCSAEAPTTAPKLGLTLNEGAQPVAREAGGAALHWMSEFRGSLAGLKALAATHCRVEAALRFVRAPFWIADQASVIIGDLRYDREKGPGFSEVEAGATEECPRFLPPWRPPFRGM